MSRIHKDEVGIKKCDWVGGIRVHQKLRGPQIEYPWFRRGVIDSGDEACELGEDIGLCLQCAKADIPIYVDCDNVVGHHK